MGLLINGTWHDQWYDTKSHGGAFKRSAAQFRNWVTADGRPGPSGRKGFKAESGRYHLYVSLACPWAHRTLIFRQLKGLSDHITVSVVHPDMLDKGWTFERDEHGATGDDLFGFDFMYQVYTKADPTYSGRVVIPPFLMGLSRRIHAAVFSFIAGVMPPMAMLGRSLLYVQSHFVA
jgi:putative glutathione S-transferase